MLKPMVIFKGTTKRSLKKVKQRDGDIAMTFQVKAWTDQVVMRKWIKDVLIPHTKGRHCLVSLIHSVPI